MIRALDAASAEILEHAVRAIGGSEYARMVVQKAYDLGRADGGHEQIKRTRTALEREEVIA